MAPVPCVVQLSLASRLLPSQTRAALHSTLLGEEFKMSVENDMRPEEHEISNPVEECKKVRGDIYDRMRRLP